MDETIFKPKYLLLIGLVVMLFATNPRDDQYYKWVKGQVKEDVAIVALQVLGFEEKEYPKTRIINWKLFSTYETNFDGYDKVFVGIGGNFFEVASTKVNTQKN